MDRYPHPSPTRPAAKLGAALAALAVMAFAAPAGAGAHGAAHGASVQDVARGVNDQVFGAIHSIPTRDAETGLLDYGEMPNGAALLSHGPDDVIGNLTGNPVNPPKSRAKKRKLSKQKVAAKRRAAARRKAVAKRRAVARRRAAARRKAAAKRKSTAKQPTVRKRGAGAHASGLPISEDPGVPAAKVQCLPAGASHFYEVIHYVPKNRTENGNVEAFKDEVVKAVEIMSEEAFGVGGAYRAFHVETDSQCRPLIQTIRGTHSGTGFGSVAGDLSSNFGKSRTDRKYLVFVEGSSACGQASLYRDESKSAANQHNVNSGFATIGPSCWSDEGRTVAHEVAHNLSAVQQGAPHNNSMSAELWHCWDEDDIMCYDEAGGDPMQMRCADGEHFDCNNDDYFHPSPPAGSYLAANFNMATDSNWITAADWTAPLVNPTLAIDDLSLPGIQNQYRVRFKVAARDNWELSNFRFGRSTRLPFNVTGECPADTGSNYGAPVTTFDQDASGNRRYLAKVEGGFGMSRAGCYKFSATVTDRAGFSITVTKVERINLPTDLAVEPIKQQLGL